MTRYASLSLYSPVLSERQRPSRRRLLLARVRLSIRHYLCELFAFKVKVSLSPLRATNRLLLLNYFIFSEIQHAERRNMRGSSLKAHSFLRTLLGLIHSAEFVLYMYVHINRLKSIQILLSRTQTKPGRTGKQEHEQTSRNHVQTL